ncbi:hypothetical protein ACOMHN_010814 [Nucella lapillus]
MASFCAMLMRSRPCRSLLSTCRRSLTQHTRRKPAIRWLASAAALLAHCQTKNLDLQSAADSRLRQESLLTGAVDQNVAAVTIVLTQTTQAVLQAEEKYRQTVRRLMDVMEHHLTVLGNKEEEDTVGDIILQGRDRLHVCHTQLQELQLLFSFVEKQTAASAEVALLAGREGGVSSLQDQLKAAQAQVKTVQEQRLHLERQLHTLQAHCVQVRPLISRQVTGNVAVTTATHSAGPLCAGETSVLTSGNR